ncbi:MAG: hypothetical protein XD93_0517 [candidate division WS6 bacterium 34_10]|jgi:hypothetical protein|uniref:Uncharacterized protein n=1 Tax=candidate division WS6 bacterium 34_10 TaxID=1641389 RepID=A0A101HHU4_9BACT|nr:MAG: hypothetical protein XD93_0517 [candidate division WS6 bacterium 34_10]
MAKKKSTIKKIRIHNPVTNSYYKIRQKSTSAGKKGSIMGKWSSKKK